ncbi:MAG: TolC family protein [Gemmatimonadaceae bacterium]|nr:TolC family protein [Gemmatimonadaceae bacterium]
MRRCLLLAGFLPAFLPMGRTVAAQTGPAPARLTLDDAVRLALRQNPTVRAELARRDETDALVRAAWANRGPVIENALVVQGNPNRPAAVLPGALFGPGSGPQVVRLGSTYESNATTSLRLPLFDPARSAAVTVARADRTEAEVALARVRDEVGARTRDAYVALVEARAQRRAAEATATWRALEATNRRALATSGRANTADRDAAALEADDARLAADQARLAERAARARLAAVLGLVLEREDGEERLEPADDITTLVAQVMTDTLPPPEQPSLAVREAEAAEAAARTRIAVERRGAWPTLSFVAASSWLGFADAFNDLATSRAQFQRTSIGVELTWARSDFGARSARVRALDAAYRRTAARREEAEVEAAAARAVAWADRAAALVQVRLAERTRTLARERVVLLQASNDAGRAIGANVARETARVAEAEAAVARAMRTFLQRDTDARRLSGASVLRTGTTAVAMEGTR